MAAINVSHGWFKVLVASLSFRVFAYPLRSTPDGIQYCSGEAIRSLCPNYSA